VQRTGPPPPPRDLVGDAVGDDPPQQPEPSGARRQHAARLVLDDVGPAVSTAEEPPRPRPLTGAAHLRSVTRRARRRRQITGARRLRGQSESANPLMSRMVALTTSGIAPARMTSPPWHVPLTVRLITGTPASSSLRA